MSAKNTRGRNSPGPACPAPSEGGDKGKARTRGLLKGNPGLNARRRPPLPERVGAAAAAVLGPEVGELVYGVTEGVRRGTVPAQAGRLVLERVLPPGRPVRLGLPPIHGPEDLKAAQDIIIDALNDGRITGAEARELQEVALRAWRARQEAEAAEAARVAIPADSKEVICRAAAFFGMVWPEEAP